MDRASTQSTCTYSSIEGYRAHHRVLSRLRGALIYKPHLKHSTSATSAHHVHARIPPTDPVAPLAASAGGVASVLDTSGTGAALLLAKYRNTVASYLGITVEHQRSQWVK